MGDSTFIIVIVVTLVAMIFTTVLPESKKRKRDEKMRSELAVGDEIQTVGGIVGTICAIKDNFVVIETGADRVRIEFVKEAVAGKRSSATEAK